MQVLVPALGVDAGDVLDRGGCARPRLAEQTEVEGDFGSVPQVLVGPRVGLAGQAVADPVESPVFVEAVGQIAVEPGHDGAERRRLADQPLGPARQGGALLVVAARFVRERRSCVVERGKVFRIEELLEIADPAYLDEAGARAAARVADVRCGVEHGFEVLRRAVTRCLRIDNRHAAGTRHKIPVPKPGRDDNLFEFLGLLERLEILGREHRQPDTGKQSHGGSPL